MPYFTGGPIGPNADAVTLDDFGASGALSFATAAEDAWDSNPTKLAVDWLRFRGANMGQRLAKPDAEAAVKQAGVKLTIPDDGYTPEALDILIRRKQDETRRQDILARAPTGVLPATARFGAQLMASVVDPLNVASAFIPVVGEARYVSMLAGAEGLLARSGVRAAVGAAEGAVGAAAIEPFAYGIHQQLADDYKMSDSLLNVAFGAAFGSVLHVGAGAIGEALHGNSAARYAGLSTEDVRAAQAFEKERAGMSPEDQARALESYSPEVRRLFGAENIEAPVHVPGEALQVRPAAEIHARLSPEMQETAIRSAVVDFVNGRMPDVENIVKSEPIPRETGDQLTAQRSTFDDVRATAERQAQPESVSVADFFAARAGEQRVAEARVSDPVAKAEEHLDSAMQRLQELRTNLEQGGMAPEILQAKLDELKPFDEAVNDAVNMGEAAKAAAICGARA